MRRRKRRRSTFSLLELLEELEEQKRINRRLVTYIVAKGLSELCEKLAYIREDEEQRSKLLRQRDTFKAFSKMMVDLEGGVGE